MDSLDAVNPRQDPVVVARVLSPTDKDSLQKSFVLLLNWMEKRAESAMVDWATFETTTDRYLDTNTGQELIQIRAAVRVMEMTL